MRPVQKKEQIIIKNNVRFTHSHSLHSFTSLIHFIHSCFLFFILFSELVSYPQSPNASLVALTYYLLHIPKILKTLSRYIHKFNFEIINHTHFILYMFLFFIITIYINDQQFIIMFYLLQLKLLEYLFR